MKKLKIVILLLLSALSLYSESAWKEVEIMNVPAKAQMQKVVSKKGNIHYVICIGNDTESIDVSVSESNYNKFKNGEELVIVKWIDTKTNKIKYSSRMKNRRVAKTFPNLQLSKCKCK